MKLEGDHRWGSCSPVVRMHKWCCRLLYTVLATFTPAGSCTCRNRRLPRMEHWQHNSPTMSICLMHCVQMSQNNISHTPATDTQTLYIQTNDTISWPDTLMQGSFHPPTKYRTKQIIKLKHLYCFWVFGNWISPNPISKVHILGAYNL